MVTVDPLSAPDARVTTAHARSQELDRRLAGITGRVPDLVRQVWGRAADRWAGDPDMVTLVDDVVTQLGGKYLRPKLVALAFVGFGGTDDRVVDPLMSAVQCLHLALCIHDDVIDGDPVRHGRPTLQAAVQEREERAGRADHGPRQGLAAGLLGGDLALTLAIGQVVAASALVPDGLSLVDDLLAAIESAVAGEVLDVRGELLPPAAEGSIRVAELKTAAYSVELPLRLGARAAGADAATLDHVSAVGRHIGIAYQLADDDLGVFGDSAVTGKSNGSDLRSGKRTELVRHAVTAASSADRAYLQTWLGRPDSDEEVLDRLRGILVSTGARAHLHDLVDRHTRSATDLIERHLPPWLGGRLIDLVSGLRRRDS